MALLEEICLTLEAGFETQPFPVCCALHAYSSRSKPSASPPYSHALALASRFLTLSSLKARLTCLGHSVVLKPFWPSLIEPLMSRIPCESALTLVLGFVPLPAVSHEGQSVLCQKLPCCADFTVLTVTQAPILVSFIVFLTFPHKNFLPFFLFSPNVCLVKIALFCFISVEVLPEVLERQNCGLNGATCREHFLFFFSCFGWVLFITMKPETSLVPPAASSLYLFN